MASIGFRAPFRPENLVAFINSALGNPADPKSCWNCLAGAIHMLIHPESFFGPDVGPDFMFGKTCTTIWPTILKFITFPRSDQELAGLVVSRRRCSCPNDWVGADFVRKYSVSVLASWNNMWQGDEPAVATSPFHCFFWHVLKHLIPYLNDLSPTAVAKRRTQVWPFAPKDCIPLGPETTVKSLHQWIHFYRDPEPFAISLLGVVGHVARNLVVPTIAASPNLAADIAKIGHAICDTTTLRVKDETLSDAQVIEIGDAFHRRIWHIERFWKGIFGESNIQPAEIKRLCGGHERSLFDLFSKALGHLHTPAFFCEYVETELVPISIQIFITAAATIYAVGNLAFQIPPTAQHMRADVLAAVIRLGKEWGAFPQASCAIPVGTILKSSKERNVCFSLGCNHSIQMLEPDSSPDNRFRRCSGCQLVSYCGRDCQVAAWRDRTIPHRDICASIKTVIKQGGGSVDALDRWREKAQAGQIDEQLARNVVEWFTKWDAMQANQYISN
ncbi:hypothetical protein C8R47DRAFT_1122506 [Mycena vitilis]|nr:hypothetical protein C8R47DRAFT_1122506 [Mycena vitilis]